MTEATLDRAEAALAAARPRRLLDLGSGSGGIGICLSARLGCSLLYGIDADPAQVEYARRRPLRPELQADFALGRFEQFACPPDGYDAIIALDSIYLAERLDPVLRQVGKSLSPNGVMWLTTYVGSTTEGGVRGRSLDDWLEMLAVAGLKSRHMHDATDEWREYAGRLHVLRLQAATRVVEELGVKAGRYALAISLRMLGRDGRPAFLNTVRRIEITAEPQRS